MAHSVVSYRLVPVLGEGLLRLIRSTV